MKESTKIYGWLPWAIAVLLALILYPGLLYIQFDKLFYEVFIGPWETAQRIETLRAINQFQEGTADTGSYWNSRIVALAGIMLLFVIGPSIWVFGETNSEEKYTDPDEPESKLKKGFMWYLGTVLVMAGLIYVIPVSMTKAYYFSNTWSSADQSRNLDELRSDLTTMAFDAAEKYYVMSGQNGSDKGTGFIAKEGKGQVKPGFQPENLEGYRESIRNTYVLGEETSDSVLIIYGIGQRERPEEDFTNADGSTGKLQIGIKVTPEAEPIFDFIDRNKHSLF